MQTSINKNKRHKTLSFLNIFSMKMELDTIYELIMHYQQAFFLTLPFLFLES